MCFGCAGQLLSLDPIPDTVAGLKAVITRERRGPDRRFGKPDSRVFLYERRAGQRRDTRAGEADCSMIDDDMILEIVVDFSEPEDFEGFTQIRELQPSSVI